MSNTYSIGIDIGGTKVMGGIIHKGELIGDIIKIPTATNSTDIKKSILQIVDNLIKNKDIKYIGVATAGVVDISTGVVVSATENLSTDYQKTNFKSLIEDEFSRLTFVDNDANAAAYGEYKYGAAKDYKNSVILTFGTGIGGGIIIDNKMYRGKSFAAGEFGHMPIFTGYELICTCGKMNCWEACASGTGIINYVKNRYKNLINSDIDVSKITTYKIFEGIKTGNEFCNQIYDDWHNLISLGLIGIMNSLSPECIVIGGGLSEFIDINRILEATVGKAPCDITIKKAMLGNMAGIIGIAALAEDNYL